MIGSQFVGKALAQFLRTFHYPSTEGPHVFNEVYYVPLGKTFCQTLTVEVLTKMGHTVPFRDIVKRPFAVFYSLCF